MGATADTTGITFATWLDDQFTQMAAEYRFKLQQCFTIWADCCKGCIITPESRDVALRCMAATPIPKLPEAPHYRTPENIAYYKTALKPDWQAILQQYQAEVMNYAV